MKKFDFRRGMWNPAEMPMTYAPMCKDRTARIRQEDDCIANSMNETLGDYDYIGIAMTEPTTGDCTVTAHCSFEKYGAPLLVFADGIHTDEEGRRRYDAIYEVVAYEGGCNVWRILPVPDPNRPDRDYTVINITRQTFAVEAGSVVEMTVRLRGKRIFVTVNDYAFDVEIPDLPDSYYIGVTTCEGLNRFYDLTIE